MAMVSRAVQAVVVTGIFTGLGTFFVGLRLYTRFIITRAPGWEDAILALSWLCTVATAICTGYQVHYGLGQHGDQLQSHEVKGLLLSLYVSISVYCASIGLTKLAILLQYQRVFTTRRFQIWCWSFIAIIISYTIATVVACLFVCTPVKKFWIPVTEGSCINEQASWFSNAAINIVTDLMIIILPMPVVQRLKLPTKQKWLLLGVFCFGGVVCIISIVRLHALLIITTSTDPTYDNAPVATFSMVETNVALISACLPTLRPLLAQWISGINASSAARGSSSRMNNSHSHKRSSILHSFGGNSLQLNSLNSRKGIERLDGNDEEDKIRVVTRVDVNVSEKENNLKSPRTLDDGRESSTETLFRSARADAGHVV